MVCAAVAVKALPLEVVGKKGGAEALVLLVGERRSSAEMRWHCSGGECEFECSSAASNPELWPAAA